MIFNPLFRKHNKKKSIFHFIWIYSKPILGIGEDLGFRNYFYIIWLLAVFPLIEIVKNDLFDHFVRRKVTFAQTIEDLIDDRYAVYTDPFKQSHFGDRYWESENDTFKVNFDKLREKLQSFSNEKFLEKVKSLIKTPEALQEWVNGIVIVEDENWMELLRMYAHRFMPIHIGDSYIPLLITPLCFHTNHFSFSKEANEM